MQKKPMPLQTIFSIARQAGKKPLPAMRPYVWLRHRKATMPLHVALTTAMSSWQPTTAQQTAYWVMLSKALSTPIPCPMPCDGGSASMNANYLMPRHRREPIAIA